MKIISNKIIEDIKSKIFDDIGHNIDLNENFYDYFDSLDLVEAIIFFENKFFISYNDEDVEKLRTINDIIKLTIEIINENNFK